MRTMFATLGANQVMPFEIAGNYFEILTCAGDLERIDWTDEDGQQVEPWLNVREGVYQADPYKAFTIKNGPTPQTIKFMVGRGSGGNRATPIRGAVSVDAFPNETRALSSLGFMACTKTAGQATKFSSVSIANPYGSGKTVIVTSLTFTADGDTEVGGLFASGSGTHTNRGVTTRMDENPPASGVAWMEGDVWTAAQVVSMVPSLFRFGLKAGVPFRVDLDRPIVLGAHAPGGANELILQALATVAGIGLSMSAQWIEQ